MRIEINDLLSEECTDLHHDASYAHALIEAMKKAPDYLQGKNAFRWVLITASEIMEEWGYSNEPYKFLDEVN